MSSEDLLGCLCFYSMMCSANSGPEASSAEVRMDMASKTPLESEMVKVEDGAQEGIMESRPQDPGISTSESLVSMDDVHQKLRSLTPSPFDLQHDLFASSWELLSAVNNPVPETTHFPPSPTAISEPELRATNSTWHLDLEPISNLSVDYLGQETPVSVPPEILSIPDIPFVNDVGKETSTPQLRKEEALMSSSAPSVSCSTYETTAYRPSGDPKRSSPFTLAKDHAAQENGTAPDILPPGPQLSPSEEPALLTLVKDRQAQAITTPTGVLLPDSPPPELSQESSEEPAVLSLHDNHKAQENTTPPGGSLLEPQRESPEDPVLWTFTEDGPAQQNATPSVNLIPASQPEPPEGPAVENAGDESSTVSANDDIGSVFDDEYYSDTSSYTASLLSDVKDYTYENGRRYHSYREGHYVLPNDDQEQDRQDLLHHVRNLVLNGALFRAPLCENLQRVLDIGTGTGIWAIDFADSFPSAEVTGTDLSPIQPSWVPPNLRFLVDDAESPWLFSASRPFDFIHARDLGGAIADWPRLLRQAYDHLRPGGWIELQEFEVTLKSDDDSLRLAPTLCEFVGRLHQASEAFRRPMNIAEGHRQRLIEAGFEDVRDEMYKVPSSGWSEDPLQKQIGRYNLCSLLMAVESYSLALFTRVLGWSNTETQAFLAGVRRDLKNPEVHTYCKLHVVYGRKPWYDYGYRPSTG